MDLQTVVIYLFLSAVFILMCREIARQKFSIWWVLVPIGIYGVIFGMRQSVGVDFPAYLQTYLRALNGITDFSMRRWEIGFASLYKFCADCELHHAILFTIIAFVPVALIFLSVRKYKWVFPFLAFTFMAGGIWLQYSNGLRQIIAFGLFAFAIPYLTQKKWLKYYIYIFIATLFHESAVILYAIPLFYLQKGKTHFNNVKTQYILLAIALICGNVNFIQSFFEEFDSLISSLGYDHYIESESKHASKLSITPGIGYYIIILTNIMIIKFSTQVKKQFDHTTFPLLYDFAYFGMLVHYAFAGVQLMGRINYYFAGFNYIVGAFVLFFLSKQKSRTAYYILLGLYILTFIAIMYRMHENTAFFRFFWQV